MFPVEQHFLEDVLALTKVQLWDKADLSKAEAEGVAKLRGQYESYQYDIHLAKRKCGEKSLLHGRKCD